MEIKWLLDKSVGPCDVFYDLEAAGSEASAGVWDWNLLEPTKERQRQLPEIKGVTKLFTYL